MLILFWESGRNGKFRNTKRRLGERLGVAPTSVGVFFVCISSVLARMSVTTGQSGYPPGAKAHVTNSGFESGETVQLQALPIDLEENNGPGQSTGSRPEGGLSPSG